jgi:small subunit ribosomal protein S9
MATTTKTEAYTEAVGRRKTSVARVRITPASDNSMQVNEKTFEAYFPAPTLRQVCMEALNADGLEQHFSVTVRVNGGGISSQSEAVRHALARALTKWSADLRKPLKASGYLKRDPRMKERRKFGLKKARKSPQWSKR